MVMKKLVKYIFFILCLLTGCQTPELIEIPSFTPGEGVYGEATISFSVSIPRTKVETKAMGDQLSADLKNLYIIVFDENGYFVESRKADYDEDNINNDIEAENAFEVTLNLTDKKRIIHFIANCPEEQIRYGHENEVISSMYVTRDAVMETSYWHRLLVDNILTDGDGNLVGETANKFKRIPMLRNYAMITVEDNDVDDDFELLRFGVYNTINKGTVAPYNKSTQTFQPFISGENLYSYDDLVGMGFEGHALIDAQLDGTFTAGDFLDEGGSYFMYERRIDNTITGSNEAPTHIILEGKFDGGQPTYYKVDLIERINNTTKFYHILRNFEYTFKLKSVTGPGYTTIQEAMSKPASNNLAGSVETQELTSVSDGIGRIYVSFTKITLVSNEDVTLRFKYIPDIDSGTVDNTQVEFDGLFDGTGTVIKQIKSIVYDADDEWGEVTFKIQDPTDIDRTQEIELLAGTNYNLHKTISFRLRNPYIMEVICYDSDKVSLDYDDNIVDKGIGKRVGVEIRLPDNLSSDMFPLDLMIEADKLSISPDVSNNGSLSLPVESGASIIPGKNSQSFHYVCTIVDPVAFKQLALLGSGLNKRRVIRTNWLTNIVESASYVVVDNEYFNTASSYFKNEPGQTESDVLGYKMVFTDLKVDPSPIFYGAGQKVDISFKLDPREVDYLPKTIHIALEGMECAKHSDNEFDIYLIDETAAVPDGLDEHTWVVKMTKGSRTVVLKDLMTEASNPSTGEGPVSFTLSTADMSYETAHSGVIERVKPRFSMLSITPDPILKGANRKVSISFTMDANDERYYEREVTITLNGLKKLGTDVSQPITITPSSASKTVTIDDLVTTAESSDVSFVVSTEGYDETSGMSDVVLRRNAEFSSVKINPSKILSDGQTGKPVSVSFSMDLNDKDFATNPVTVVLTGMKVKDTDSQNTITVCPNERNFTIDNLVTTVSTGEISAQISAAGYNTATATAEFFVPEFKNLRFTDTNGDEVTTLRAGEEHIVDFNFDMTYFEEGMTVSVDLAGLVPYNMPTTGPGSIYEASTRAATRYTFNPEGKKCTIRLKTDKNASTWSVKLSADGFAADAEKSLDQLREVTYSGGNITITEIGIERPNVSGWGTSTYEATIDGISVDGTEKVSYKGGAEYTYQRNQGTLTITLTSISITGQDLNADTEVTINLTITHNRGYSSATSQVSVTKRISELKLTLQN